MLLSLRTQQISTMGFYLRVFVLMSVCLVVMIGIHLADDTDAAVASAGKSAGDKAGVALDRVVKARGSRFSSSRSYRSYSTSRSYRTSRYSRSSRYTHTYRYVTTRRQVTWRYQTQRQFHYRYRYTYRRTHQNRRRYSTTTQYPWVRDRRVPLVDAE